MSPKKRRKRKPPVPHRIHGGQGRRPGPGLPPPEEPQLVRDVREALAADSPFDLLALTSTIVASADPRLKNPFDDAPDDDGASLADAIEALLHVPDRESTALLTAIGELCSDELLRARINRELGRRTHPLPRWLRPLGPPTVHSAVVMDHVLGDGDNVAIGATTASGHELTALVYIDHNLGTVAKDGFVIPEHIEFVKRQFRDAGGNDPDVSLIDLGLADARARIDEAIEWSARIYPPLETDTWPASRPLIEWIVQQVPAGGIGYQRPEWSDADRAVLTEQFFASPFGRGHDAEDRELFESLLWFACDYGPGDPLRWSPVNVEILLTDWLPRKVVADSEFLSRAPDLLRSFIRFSHAERGIRELLTTDTLAAVDAYEPEYQDVIRSDRPQGPAALLAAMGLPVDPDEFDFAGEFDDVTGDPRSHREYLLDTLRGAVGGAQALEALDTEPLPDDALQLDQVPEDVHERIYAIASLTDVCCDELLDVEARTACRRLLTDVARADPDIFRRRAKNETAAAAVTWIIAKANDLFESYSGGLTAVQLAAWFGVYGSVSQRAQTMLRALGIDSQYTYQLQLGTSRYLVSARRQRILERRDRFLSLPD